MCAHRRRRAGGTPAGSTPTRGEGGEQRAAGVATSGGHVKRGPQPDRRRAKARAVRTTWPSWRPGGAPDHPRGPASCRPAGGRPPARCDRQQPEPEAGPTGSSEAPRAGRRGSRAAGRPPVGRRIPVGRGRSASLAGVDARASGPGPLLGIAIRPGARRRRGRSAGPGVPRQQRSASACWAGSTPAAARARPPEVEALLGRGAPAVAASPMDAWWCRRRRWCGGGDPATTPRRVHGRRPDLRSPREAVGRTRARGRRRARRR